MKYLIPNPYDYHGEGEFIVEANSPEEAVDKLKKSKFAENKYSFKPEYENITELTEDIYENSGCDC